MGGLSLRSLPSVDAKFGVKCVATILQFQARSKATGDGASSRDLDVLREYNRLRDAFEVLNHDLALVRQHLLDERSQTVVDKSH
ncbi:hypothetical protein RvVAR0630_pl04120 (plasmid) [Agrobacterium vitis]|nr:hypothetical protein RvVAR0630_pl04120 [Agrobacterium vitis]